MTNDPAKLSRRTVVGAALVTPAAAASFAALNVARSRAGIDTIDLFDFIPQALRTGILARIPDNSPSRAVALAGYIQHAIDTAASQRRRLIVPAGLYNIAPTGSFAAEAGHCRRCFAIRSDMHIDAEPGATFRIIDAVSTNKAVVFMCMFGTNEQLANLSWRGLEMDMNGQHNPISPERASGKYSLLNQAHIFISGTPDGHAALATDVAIDQCRFMNTPGVSCIVLAQSNTPRTQLGSNWRIADCDFIDGGSDTPDHSAIYAWAQNVVCQRCTFANSSPKMEVGGNVAFEVHGSHQKFNHNKIFNYYQGVWIDGNKSISNINNIDISNNIFDKVSAYGIMFYGEMSHVSQVTISQNKIVFDDSVYTGVDIKIGIGCLAPLAQKQVRIEGNTISGNIFRTASSGVTLQSAKRAGHIHDGFVIRENAFEGITFGVQIVTNPICGLGTIKVERNHSYNLSRAGAFSSPQGVGVDFNNAASPIRELIVLNNTCVDNRGKSAQCAFGIRIQGKIGALRAAGNSASGMTSAAYAEGTLTVGRRLQTAA